MTNEIRYEGWELDHFDLSKNFRNYQYELIKDYIKEVVVEVGPGNGISVQLYKKLCRNIDLYEPDKILFKNLQKKFLNIKNINLHNSTLVKNSNFYNTVLYLDVLEHIKDSENEILKAYDTLKVGGNLIINVPAFQFLYSNFDKDVGHFKRYNKNDFLEICKKNNLKISKITYYDSIGFMLSFISKFFSINYKNKFKHKIIFWDKLISISKILDKCTLNSFGKSLLVIITK